MSAGAPLADAKRQLVLRSFATANGDPAKTARIVGISADEVKSEISSMLNGNGSTHAGKQAVSSAPIESPAARGAAPAKPKAKKR
jgi:hypothetical protein